MTARAAALGAVVVAAHAAGFVALVPRCSRPQLAVELGAGPPAPSIPGARLERDGTSPGLRLTRWVASYRGGYTRSVGVASLEGPRQDPDRPACAGRVIVGQRLLDDGRAGPGTIAGEMARTLDAELRGERWLGAGGYRRIDGLTVRWAQLAHHPDDLLWVGPAPHGYVRAELSLVFDRVAVPVVVALVPSAGAGRGALAYRIEVRAGLAFGNRALQWLSDQIGGDRRATQLARSQLDDALVSALAPPPPLELPGGHRLSFTFCGDPPELVEGAWAALPFAIELGRVAGDPRLLPPRHGRAPRAAVAPATTLAIDLDVDALNALLFELWRGGVLDRRLAEAGVARRFNDHPTVAALLSLRIGAPVLALPPVVSASPRGLSLHADARIAIHDGGATTIGRLWSGLELALGRAAGPSLAAVSVDLGALELTCERTPTTLVPCYGELVAALRDRRDQLHGELTGAFSELLRDLFVDRRLGAPGLPADLVIRAASPSMTEATPNGSLRLDLDAVVVPAR